MLDLRYDSINYFIGRLRQKKYFSLVGYSDAEWFCILRYDLGATTGLGQLLNEATGRRLLEVLLKHQPDSDFLVAIPEMLWTTRLYVRNNIGPRIESMLHAYNLDFRDRIFERDQLTDDLARKARLYRLITQLQNESVVIIGNKYLRGLEFLKYKYFIEISSPNFHLESGGIERAVDQALNYGQSATYLVSAGLSAALIIGQLHDRLPESSFIDCGSIWDAFVGIGEQRTWRADLYRHPRHLSIWKRKNLYGR